MNKRLTNKRGQAIVIEDNEPDEEYMPVPKIANEFWKVVETRVGLKYTAKQLWKKGLKYFEWIEKNPFFEEKPFGTGHTAYVTKLHAMTEVGFRLFAGISEGQWHAWKRGDRGNEGHQAVALKISEIIYHQKFTGAAADFFNANIISRELGLADKTQIENIASVLVSKDELIELSRQLDQEI